MFLLKETHPTCFANILHFCFHDAHFNCLLQEHQYGFTCRSLQSEMKMTRWCCSSAPSGTSHCSNSRLKMRQPEVWSPYPCIRHDWTRQGWSKSECVVNVQPLLSELNLTQSDHKVCGAAECYEWLWPNRRMFPGTQHTTVQVLRVRVSEQWSLWVDAVPCPRGWSVPLRLSHTSSRNKRHSGHMEMANVWKHWL